MNRLWIKYDYEQGWIRPVIGLRDEYPCTQAQEEMQKFAAANLPIYPYANWKPGVQGKLVLENEDGVLYLHYDSVTDTVHQLEEAKQDV